MFLGIAPAIILRVPPDTIVEVGVGVGDVVDVGVDDGVVVALPQPARTMTQARTSERIRHKMRLFTLTISSL